MAASSKNIPSVFIVIYTCPWAAYDKFLNIAHRDYKVLTTQRHIGRSQT